MVATHLMGLHCTLEIIGAAVVGVASVLMLLLVEFVDGLESVAPAPEIPDDLDAS
jgi:hypothetical protein